jgi:non-specific serine/threonine protein kinase
MTKLTTQLLASFPYHQHADSRSIQRGQKYYSEGRVWDIEVSETQAVCEVSGDSSEYTVTIALHKKTGKLVFDCDCPYAYDGNFCKHMVAAGLELKDYLEDEEDDYDDADDYEEDYEDDDDVEIETSPKPAPLQQLTQFTRQWKNKLDTLFQQLPRSSTSGSNIQRYAAFLLMEKSPYSYQNYSFTPYLVKAKNWPELQNLVETSPETVNDLLEKNHEWITACELIYNNPNPQGCLNLSRPALNHLVTIYQMSHYYGGMSMADHLPMLAQFKVPFFQTNRNLKSVYGRITILPEPVQLQVMFTHQKGNLLLEASLQHEQINAGIQRAEIISHNPPWLVGGNTIFLLQDPSHINLIQAFPIAIPESEADFFRENYLRRIAEILPIQSDLIHWHETNADPIPRLYLRDDKDSTLRADLRFAYGEYEVTASKNEETQSVEPIPDTWDLVRINRQPAREQQAYQLLADPVYRLKRAGSQHPYGTFELRARAHPFDFLLHSIPLLTAAGFEIYGEEKLNLGKINRATPSLRVNITSGIDWFDLKTLVEFGDQQISFHDVRKALKRGERYIKLADGSVGQIPEDWLEKYKHLWNLARETEDGFRVSDFHIPLIDDLLEGSATIQTPPDLPQRRERFRHFEQIAPQPLPQGFTGELRPYQKHGFDWLHFLREYRFGGILADDMGLGKTVQMLTYLLSLKEQAQAESDTEKAHSRSTLLIVPKSLIANWQRESEKFTPDLRFLEYIGNFRNKDTAIFNDYDVILTTYGTMLRDVELLSKYEFNHIVLDESQAIKNPLAKSAKAARLLKARHRLVMTGTPVENNTFELWSQFAFLNPGLLGNLDYFKKEFATPIESAGDEATAATLRKLVYPFILRRTKEQVAPELPPRTERVIYTDMDTAQKRLYTQTKERYRAELLGLIESEGIDDARFKILEGLLRLRQISIHPALVDSNYRGDAPKFEFLLETLDTLQAENHKALVFSQFIETLRLVRAELDKRNLRYEYLDGKTRDRQAHVDSFQNDPSIPFFLISLKAGGVGLNLTAADYVIHLDPWWNPAVEMQASDRAHRIGQDKPVFVYKIIARDTVEEKILQLQDKKRALVQNLIATESSFFKSLTRDDVKMLFS